MCNTVLSIGAWGVFDHLYKMSTYPKEGETIELNMDSTEFDKIYYGDCSINIAYIIASLGCSSALATVVGNDFISSGYAEYLKKNQVDISDVKIVDGMSSGHNLIFFDDQGSGFCFSLLGASKRQNEYRVSSKAIDNASIIVISEMFSLYTLTAIRYAKKKGKITIINGMVGTAKDKAVDFLSCTDILFINESEYKELLAVLQITDFHEILKLGVKKIFLTKGKKGGTVLSELSSETFSIIPSKNVVDTTGAGDSFVAGTVAAILKGFSDIEAARIGATVSSFIIEKWGCQTNIPSWKQVMNRYKKYLNITGG